MIHRIVCCTLQYLKSFTFGHFCSLNPRFSLWTSLKYNFSDVFHGDMQHWRRLSDEESDEYQISKKSQSLFIDLTNFTDFTFSSYFACSLCILAVQSVRCQQVSFPFPFCHSAFESNSSSAALHRLHNQPSGNVTYFLFPRPFCFHATNRFLVCRWYCAKNEYLCKK